MDNSNSHMRQTVYKTGSHLDAFLMKHTITKEYGVTSSITYVKIRAEDVFMKKKPPTTNYPYI